MKWKKGVHFLWIFECKKWHKKLSNIIVSWIFSKRTLKWMEGKYFEKGIKYDALRKGLWNCKGMITICWQSKWKAKDNCWCVNKNVEKWQQSKSIKLKVRRPEWMALIRLAADWKMAGGVKWVRSSNTLSLIWKVEAVRRHQQWQQFEEINDKWEKVWGAPKSSVRKDSVLFENQQ